MPALGVGAGTAFAQGLDANKPAAATGNTGYYWFSTDILGGTLFQSTGSTWVQLTTGVSAIKPNGLTGAVAASRFAGGTTSSSPASGTFAKGDFVVDQTGAIWVCTVAGTPGTWVSASGGGVTSLIGTANEVIVSASTGAVTLSTPQSIATTSQPTFATIAAGGITGAVAASRHAGAVASGAPASGTFLLGDFVVDQTGKMWVCTSAGTPGTWGQVGGSSSLTSFNLFIGADVALTTANSVHDLLSQSCVAGTWLFWASVLLLSSGAGDVTGRIWESGGPTYYGLGEVTNNTSEAQLTFQGAAVLASTTTVKFSAVSNSATHTAKASAVVNGTGNFATSFFGLKVA